jgi:hypothetical protein
MKRKASILVLLAGLTGGGSPALAGQFMSSVWNQQPDGAGIRSYVMPDSGSLVGPYGQPVPIVAPAQLQEPSGADYARAMLARSFPGDVVQQAYRGQLTPPHLLLMGGAGPGMPPSQGLAPPGGGPPGAVPALGGIGPGISAPYSAYRTEIRFVGPSGMKVSWYAPRPGGGAGFTAQYLEAPARYNFLQASIYRLKLSDIPNRPGVELYPTLEVVPATPKTATFLAHAAVPVNFTEEDFEQVAAGNFIVKVIYLPDPHFQDLAATGPDEVVSTRLEPGVDPIIEAKRRGSILAIVRLGNIDLEAPNTPAMDAPPPGHGMGLPPGAMPVKPGMPGLPGMPQLPMPGMPIQGQPNAPTMPLPIRPNTPPAPATPLGQLPMSSPVQPVSATARPVTTAQPTTTWRNSLPDLMGKPTTDR